MALELVKQGKVCDIYRNKSAPNLMFFNRTDRFSVGDKVFPGTIQYKGLILNQMSLKWMKLLESNDLITTHIVASDAKTLMNYGVPMDFLGSVVAAQACIPIPIECIVRGYYIPESSSWAPYKKDCNMYGNILPKGLKESEILPAPIYTPSTKAPAGEHDENITFDQSINVIEKFLAENFVLKAETNIHTIAYEIALALRKKSLFAYTFAHEYALGKGIVLADTKLEFGIMQDKDGSWKILLIDEAFTPDTTRYWDTLFYTVGKPQPSMDKQFIRRYVYQELKWDGKSEPPEVSEYVKRELSIIYCNIYKRLFDEDIVTLTTNLLWEWKRATEYFDE